MSRGIPPFSTDVRSRRFMQSWPGTAPGSIHLGPCAGGRDCAGVQVRQRLLHREVP